MRNQHPSPTYIFASISVGLGTALPFWFLLHWPWYWAWWAGFGAVAFVAYGWDKLQAKRNGAKRIPEVALHLLALSGGVAGAWIGRFVFRHKTRHWSFTIVLLLATALHAALWYSVLRRS